MNGISDASLGSQFWITMDLRALSELYEAHSAEGAKEAAGGVQVDETKAPSVIGGDAVLTSLASGMDAKRLRGAVGQARLLGAQQAGDKTVDSILDEMDKRFVRLFGEGRGFDRLAQTVARMNRFFLAPEQRAQLADEVSAKELDVAKKAMAKILASRDFTERALSEDPLDKSGRLAFVNAALGVIKLVREGQLDLDRTSDYFMGEVLDINKPGDMLRMAVKTARIAREKFVDETGLNKLVERDPALRPLVDRLVAARKEASKILDIRLDLGDMSAKTVKAKLKEAREAMRAFRYDLDRATGRSMTFMESVRRKMDDWFSSNQNRVSRQDYRSLVQIEDELHERLTEEGWSPEDVSGAFRSSSETSSAATELTHATNNHIRYFFTGVEGKYAKFESAAHKALDPLVAKGGTKYVRFEAGLDVRAGGSLGKNVTLDARAGAKAMTTAKIVVAPGGGSVTVTYFTGGGAEASAEADVGIGKWNGENTKSAKVGGKASANARIAGGRGRTVVYRSIDEFIRDCRGASSLVSTGKLSSFLSLGKVWQMTRALLRKGSDLMTAIGLRIHKTRVDNNAYRAILQRNGVISKLDTVLAAKERQRGFKAGDWSYDVVTGGIDTGTQVDVRLYRGLDSKTGQEKSASVFNATGAVGFEGSRQRRVRGSEMRALVDTFRQESDAMLDFRLEDYLENRSNLKLKDNLTDRQALGELAKMVVDLETRVAESSDKADGDMWTQACRDLKAVMAQYVKVERRLTAEVRELEATLPPPGEYGPLTSAQAETKAKITGLTGLLKDAKTFFSERLTSPKMDIPEDIYRRELVDVTNANPAGKSVKKVSMSVEFNVGADYVADVAKGSPSKLEGNVKDDAGLAFGKTLGQTAIKQPVTVGMNALGASEKLEITRTSETFDRPDVRPWRNGKTVTWEFKLKPNLPIRLLVEQIARKMIDTETEGKPPEDIESVKKATMKTVLAQLGIGIAVEALVTEYAALTIGEVAKAMVTGKDASGAQKFFAGPLMKSVLGTVPLQGLEVGMQMDSSQSIILKYEHGRRACLAVGSNEKMTSSLGFRFQAGPVGVGVHATTEYGQSVIERSVYLDPHFDTWLDRTEDFLRTGDRAKLSQFLAHNRKGVLKAFDSASLALSGKAEKGSDADVILARMNGAEEVLLKIGGERSDIDGYSTASQLDRAAAVQTELYAAQENLSAVAASAGATDADRIDAVERLMVAIVRAYGIAKEAGVS